MASTSISGPPSNSVGNVCTVKRETGIDLEQHRRQGHWPFHSQCLECAPSGPAHCASQLLCLCCPPPPCLSCASLNVLPCGARVIVLSLCSCGLAVSLGICAPRCACAGSVVSRVVCPPLLWFRSLSFLPPLPRGWSCVRPGPACTPVCWCLPLGICCICDGPVALLHAWSVVKLCYPSVIRFMATKATSPVWGFHPLHHVTGDVGELSLAILRYSSC